MEYKATIAHLELPEDATEASDVLDNLLREESSGFGADCSCSLRAWFCCSSFSQFTRALCSASSSSKGFRLPVTARLNDSACVCKNVFMELSTVLEH